MPESTYYDRISLRELFNYHELNRLLLPNFQRDFVWKPEQQEALLASLMVDIPVGAVLILEGSKESFGYRKLSVTHPSGVQPTEPVWYLLDGQQRMSTLYTILADCLGGLGEWKDNWEEIYYHLRLRWFLQVVPTSEYGDAFGYKNLSFENTFRGSNPDDIQSFIIHKRVWKTKDKQWHHPEYLNATGHTVSVADDSGEMKKVKYKNLPLSRRKLETARLYSGKGVVPLYDIWNKTKDSRPLHLLTLRQIAQARADDLREEIGSDKKKLISILESTDTSIRDYIAQDEEGEIDRIWTTRYNEWAKEVSDYLESLLAIKLPYIKLPESEIDRGIAIFEQMNTGGTELDTYDLIVARAATKEEFRKDSSLSHRITSILSEEFTIPSSLKSRCHCPSSAIPSSWSSNVMDTVHDESPSDRVKDEFLSFLSILAQTSYGKVDEVTGDHTRSKYIMNLTADQINNYLFKATTALTRALCFLQFRCGITSVKDVPYKRMILPLGYLFVEDNNWNNPEAHDKAEYWYWSSVLSGAYRYEKNRVSINDIQNLYQWVIGSKSEPFMDRRKNILMEEGYSDKKTLIGFYDKDMRSVITAPRPVVRTILHYVLSRCPKDLLPENKAEIRLSSWLIASEQTVEFNDGDEVTLDLQDHHIYPLAQATNLGQSSKEIRKVARKKNGYHELNSVLNRTYISDVANRLISGWPPTKYLAAVPQVAVAQHLIPTPFKDAYDKIQDKNYEPVLSSRYHKIYDTLIQELDNLEG